MWRLDWAGRAHTQITPALISAIICHMDMRFVHKNFLLHGLDPKVLYRLRIVDCRSLQCKIAAQAFRFWQPKVLPLHEQRMRRACSDVLSSAVLPRFDLQERMVREHVLRMLRAVNLEGFIDRQTHTLSGGQKQRVAIAGALAQCPKVTFCCQTSLHDHDITSVYSVHCLKSSLRH